MVRIASVGLWMVGLYFIEPLPTAQAERAGQILAEYAAGNYDIVRHAAVRTSRHLQGYRDAVRRSSGVSDDTKAAFLLEVVHAAHIEAAPATGERGLVMKQVLEDACGLLKSRPPSDPFAGIWHSAAIAALQNYGSGGVVILSEHLDHARPYLPPSATALARAHRLELFAWTAINVLAPSFDANSPLTFEARLSRGILAAVERAITALEPALEFPESRGEAFLRIAALTDAVGRSSDAVRLFDLAEQHAPDDWVRFLSLLLRGRALERDGHYSEARTFYEGAGRLFRDARSVHLAIAANLVASGQGSAEQIDRAVATSASAASPDPWPEFSSAEYRFWPARRDAMRKRLR